MALLLRRLSLISFTPCEHTHDSALACKAVGKTLEVAKVCSVTNTDVLTAYQREAKDFEDCPVAACAKSIDCDYIITRRTSRNSTCQF